MNAILVSLVVALISVVAPPAPAWAATHTPEQAARIHYQRGETAFEAGNLKVAIAEWKDVLRLKPTSTHTRKMLDSAEADLGIGKHVTISRPAVPLPSGSVTSESAQTPASVPARFLPDPNLTPGAVLNVTSDQVCVPGYSRDARHVTSSEKAAVWAEYRKAHPDWGLPPQRTGAYEMDHLISLELGGSNAPQNLWPEPYSGMWDARVKDRLENYLHRQVCAGRETLRDAQQQIDSDWIVAYKRDGLPAPAFGGSSGTPASVTVISQPGAYTRAPATGQNFLVWVNTATGVYHSRGSRWYGHTSRGKYMPESEAIKDGYRAAANNQ